MEELLHQASTPGHPSAVAEKLPKHTRQHPWPKGRLLCMEVDPPPARPPALDNARAP